MVTLVGYPTPGKGKAKQLVGAFCEGAARRGIEQLDAPLMDDAARLRSLERMAWAQWSIAELTSGEPFRLLAECDFKQRGAEEVVA